MERQHYSIAERRSLTLARGLLQTVFHRGNLDALGSLASADAALHHPIPGFAHDRAGFGQMVTDFHAGFRGFDVLVQHMLAREGVVAIRWTLEAQHSGAWMDEQPSGKSVSVPGVTYSEFDIDESPPRLREHWLHFDALQLLEQIRA